MSIFTYIGNVVTGRIAHWNDTNNREITKLWKRATQLPDTTRIVVQDFIVSCTTLMDYLLGPDRGKQRLISMDPSRVTRQQFAAMHAILLDSLAGLFLQVNPSFTDSVKRGLLALTGRDPQSSRIIQLAETMDTPDVMAVGCAVWEELVALAGSSQGTTAMDAYPFSALLGSVANQSFQDIRDKLRGVPP